MLVKLRIGFPAFDNPHSASMISFWLATTVKSAADQPSTAAGNLGLFAQRQMATFPEQPTLSLIGMNKTHHSLASLDFLSI